MSRKCSATVESNSCEKFSFATCDGCHQPFCLPHLNDHQQDLAGQMERLVHNHNLLREQLNDYRFYPDNDVPDFSHGFTLIDEWEKRTIAQMNKIVIAEAERARNTINNVMMENRHRMYSNDVAVSEELDRLKHLLETLGKELQTRIETMDYLEPNLHQWDTQLRDISRYTVLSQVQMRKIIEKLSVREVKEIQIDVSNALDIIYEDEERFNQTSNNIDEEMDWIQRLKGFDLEVSNYTSSLYPIADLWADMPHQIGHASNSIERTPSLLRSSSDHQMAYMPKYENQQLTSSECNYKESQTSEKMSKLVSNKNDRSSRINRKTTN